VSWPMVKLVDISIHLRNGSSIKQTEGTGGLPITRIETIANRDVNLEKCGYAGIGEQEYLTYRLEKGDILISHINFEKHLVKCAIFESDRKDIIHGMNLLCFRVNKTAYPKFVYYYLSSTIFLSKLPRITKKSVNQASFTVTHFKELEIPLPPLDEQKRIAAILDKADAIRRKRKQAIQLAENFLRSVFLDMFGDDLQRSTNVTSFGDITILDAKMVDPREEEYLDLLHIGPDRIEKNTGKLLPAITAREERLISKKFLFDDQYILYSKIRPYLRKVAVPDFKALCSADMYPIKPVQGKVTREFLWMLLLSDYFDNYVSSLPSRANIPKLNKKELAAFEFYLPEFSKVERFTEIVKNSFGRSKVISDCYVESETLFNSLSQKAFAGEL